MKHQSVLYQDSSMPLFLQLLTLTSEIIKVHIVHGCIFIEAPLVQSGLPGPDWTILAHPA